MKKKHYEESNRLKELLSQSYTLEPTDLGSDARLAKKGFTFETEAYEIRELGHLCIMRMKAMFGLMKMETTVLSVTCRDMPLINFDRIIALEEETQMVELYDTQLSFEPHDLFDAFLQIQERDADLLDYSSGEEHWYDEILYPCSYRKTGKGVSTRLEKAAADCAEAYLSLIAATPACDPVEKQRKIQTFAETLFAHGGPAVNQVTRLFGRKTAERLIVHHMYGVR